MNSAAGTTTAPAHAPVTRMDQVSFAYGKGEPVLVVEHFSVQPGESVFLRGPSGTGKSTLLSLLAGILVPGAGQVQLLGERLSELPAARRDARRAAHMGVIFQLFNLVPYLSVLDNVTLPCQFSSLRQRRARAVGAGVDDEARRLLAALGIDGGLLERPATALSVGQQQRVAAARALIGAPELVLADEPTSALDADARERFVTLLREECARHGTSLLFVSHDRSLAALFDRTVDLAELNRVAG